MTIDDRYLLMPWPEAVEELRGKIQLDTDSWRDIEGDEHDAFFVVAGAKGSLLSELHQAVSTAIEQGTSLEDWQKQFEEIAEDWEFNGDAAWRSRIILQTNLRTAYGRGREEYQLDPDVQALLPYAVYSHGDSDNPRPGHLAMDGQVFRSPPPWSLPSGYGCSCRWNSISQREFERMGAQLSSISLGDSVETDLPDGSRATGRAGPDPGWDRQPGQVSNPERRQRIVQRVIDRSPPAISSAIQSALNRYSEQITEPQTPAVETTPDQTTTEQLAAQLEASDSFDYATTVAEYRERYSSPGHTPPPPPPSAEASAALSMYTANEFKLMNAALRGELEIGQLVRISPTRTVEITPELLRDTQALIEIARAGLAESPRFEGTVYRGTGYNPERLARYQPGEIMTEEAFISTSSEKFQAFEGGLQYVIESRSGVDISQFSGLPDEAEVLLPPGRRYRVISVELGPDAYGDEVWQVHMEELEE